MIILRRQSRGIKHKENMEHIMGVNVEPNKTLGVA